MFEAIVLICSMVTNQCLEAVDTWGPYKTEQACIERTVKMKEAIESENMGWKAVTYKCERGDSA